LSNNKTQESRYYKVLRAIVACSLPLPFVGSRPIVGATLVIQDELPPNVTTGYRNPFLLAVHPAGGCAKELAVFSASRT
jgi:hypothetical protein